MCLSCEICFEGKGGGCRISDPCSSCRFRLVAATMKQLTLCKGTRASKDFNCEKKIAKEEKCGLRISPVQPLMLLKYFSAPMVISVTNLVQCGGSIA